MDNKMSKDQLLAEFEMISNLQQQLESTLMEIEHFRRFTMPVLMNALFESLKNDKQ